VTATTVSPDKVLKELADLWVKSAREQPPEIGTGVLRACSMTLIVVSEASEDAQQLGETIAALMPEHPARAILIRLRGGGERSLTARVYSQCWMPFGQRRQICCEQVEITASDAALADLPPVILPLTVPDLPVILWCRSGRLTAMPEFAHLGALATKVIVDSGAMPDSKTALRRLAAAINGDVLIGDLAWTRLTRWREMLSQVFENQQYAGELPKISNVDLQCHSASYTTAVYLANWIGNCLGDAGVWSQAKRGGGRVVIDESVDSMRVRLSGDGFAVELSRSGDRMVAQVNGVSHCTNLPQPSDYLLMREELAVVQRDPVFERTLASVARAAYPTV
jgi:glucose-6-phosphate dehydrogenase assembly protein OpcA